MAIYAEVTEKFTLTPAGQYSAVCCEVVDLGFDTKTYKNKDTGEDEQVTTHQCQIYFQLNKRDPESGKLYDVRSKPFNLKLTEGSHLRDFLRQWRGHDIKPEERQFDLEQMVGVTAFINVIHNKVGDKSYANIATIMPLPEGMPAIQPENWEPRQRSAEAQSVQQHNAQAVFGQPAQQIEQQAQAAASVPADAIPF